MGVVVLLMSDVVGSTALWAAEPGQMDAAMARHHAIVHGAVAEQGGFLPRDQGEGDAVFAGFDSALAAVVAAARIQRALAAEPWPTTRALTVRIGIHAGEVIQRDGNLFGDAVNRCARIRSLGHGGQTLLSAAVHELVRDRLPSGLRLTDLGEHRMKDLTRPEPIHQLDVDGLPDRFPPLVSLGGLAHNLPAQPTPLLGRERDVAHITALLEEHRLVTVTGFGGMGKTRLALQVAAEHVGSPRTADGVWFVDLSAVTDPGRVAAELNAVLDVAEAADGAEAALLAWAADRQLLIVVDNLEQVLGCAPLLAALLAAGPGVRLVATSREPLRVRGEQVHQLSPLALPAPDRDWSTDLDGLTTYAAVRLFVTRACEARSDFTVDNRTAPAVAAICAAVDGLPLAIELAAARVRVLDPDALLARLSRALQVLTRGGADRPLRHQTLRATIDWSYRSLSTTEQLVLDRLSVFPAATTLAAIEGVCTDEDLDALEVLDVLTSLVDRSLVTVVPPTRPGRPTTYLLLVSIREYAAEQLAARGETARTHDRLVAWVRTLLDYDDDPFTPELTAQRQEAMRTIESAWSWVAQTAPAELVGFPLGLVWCYEIQQRMSEIVALCEAATSNHPAPHPAKGEWLLEMASATHYTQGFAASVPVSRAAVAAAREAGDACALVEVLGVCASLLDGPDLQLRRERLAWLAEAESIVIPPTTGAWKRARAQQWVLGAVIRLCALSDPGRADAASLAWLTFDRGERTRALHHRGDMLATQGRWQELAELLAPVEDDRHAFGPSSFEVHVSTFKLAEAMLLLGDTARAQTLLDRSVEDLRDASDGERQFLRFLLRLQSELAYARGEAEAALALLEQAARWDVTEPSSTRRMSLRELHRRLAILHRLLADDVRADLDLAAARVHEPDIDNDWAPEWALAVEAAWSLAATDPDAASARVDVLRAEQPDPPGGGWRPAFSPAERLATLAAHLAAPR